MTMGRLVGASILQVMVLVGSCRVAAKAADCEFTYGSGLADALVIPALKKKFGDAYIYFDFDSPVVFERNHIVVVQLSATRVVGGNALGFEDLFFVEIDPCSKSMLRSYATQQYREE